MEYLGCENCAKRECGRCFCITEEMKDNALRLKLVLTFLEPSLIRMQLFDEDGEEWDSQLVGQIIMRPGKVVYEKYPGQVYKRR